jgi:beta-N-acetylhexosaminidase
VSAHYLGQLNQVALTQKYAGITAKTLAELGLNLNLAPVLDLNSNPLCPVIGKLERSFSALPAVVSAHALEWIRSHHRQHILCALKHFPGHGSARHDTHQGFVDISDTWSSEELIPYTKMLSTGLCDMVMTAHIFHSGLDPEWPATLSHSIISGLLRRKLQYAGVVISDDLQMQAITAHHPLEQAVYRAIMAGVDILTFGNNFVYDEHITSRVTHIIKKLVSTGAIPRERIEQSYRRIWRLKERVSSGSFNAH